MVLFVCLCINYKVFAEFFFYTMIKLCFDYNECFDWKTLTIINHQGCEFLLLKKHFMHVKYSFMIDYIFNN